MATGSFTVSPSGIQMPCKVRNRRIHNWLDEFQMSKRRIALTTATITITLWTDPNTPLPSSLILRSSVGFRIRAWTLARFSPDSRGSKLCRHTDPTLKQTYQKHNSIVNTSESDWPLRSPCISAWLACDEWQDLGGTEQSGRKQRMKRREGRSLPVRYLWLLA